MPSAADNPTPSFHPLCTHSLPEFEPVNLPLRLLSAEAWAKRWRHYAATKKAGIAAFETFRDAGLIVWRADLTLAPEYRATTTTAQLAALRKAWRRVRESERLRVDGRHMHGLGRDASGVLHLHGLLAVEATVNVSATFERLHLPGRYGVEKARSIARSVGYLCVGGRDAQTGAGNGVWVIDPAIRETVELGRTAKVAARVRL